MSRNVVVILVLALVGTAAAQIGISDTVGGTIYDWQFNGPVVRRCYNAPGYGFHVAWMYSNDTVGSQADRNMRYNFYDYASRSWNWMDPNFMLSGVNVFMERSGFGNLAADPTTGAAVVSCHQGNMQVCAARDIAAGAGIFEYCPGPGGALYPVLGVTPDQTIHAVFEDGGLKYSRIRTWCNWDSVVNITPPGPSMYPSHNMAASRVSNRVCVAWMDEGTFPYGLDFRISADGGDSWGPIESLPPPGRTIPDTTWSYGATSPFPFYDSHDRLHILADLVPSWHDTTFAAPVEIWHWCPDLSPAWSRVHRAEMDPHGSQQTGTNAQFAGRPSIGEDSDGGLYVTWEQFDTLNIEPLTDLMRADIWLAGSGDNGATWGPAWRITVPNTESKRYPCVIDRTIEGGGVYDSLVVVYLADSVAGARAGPVPVGPWSNNPIIALKFAIDSMGVAESRHGQVRSQTLGLTVQNPVRGRAEIRYVLPAASEFTLSVFDAAGRCVARLAAGERPEGGYTLNWDASASSPGIYFCRLVSGRLQVSRKLVVQR
jgi:hypothetical protein